MLGLPSTTAIVLCGTGLERGLDESLRMAEAGMLGLVAAVTLPVVYALAAAKRRQLPVATCAAVAGYLAIATAMSLLPSVGPLGAAGVPRCWAWQRQSASRAEPGRSPRNVGQPAEAVLWDGGL